jgi:SNF family Na+-dependent transporter
VNDAWSGRTGFILAAIGSAVGLGSIWKFPYEVGANGGAAFVLFYLAGLVLAVVPLMLAEFAMGRRGAGDAAASLAALASAHGAPRGWAWVGVLGVFTGMLILSFYSVIGGWTLAYLVETLRAGLPAAAPGAVQARYDALLDSPARMIGYHALFLALAAAVVARGVSAGIEVASKVLMPVLVLLLGAAAAAAFYLLLFVAALASAISMLELGVAPAMRRLGWTRRRASAALAGACVVAGLATVFSFNRWAHWQPTPFDAIDHLTSNVMLPTGGLALSLFAGWVLPRAVLAHELHLGPRAAVLLHATLRWVTPVLIVVAAAGPLLLSG